MLQSRWSQNTFIAALAVILLLLSWWGWMNAVAGAKSKTILKDSKAITQGLGNFMTDQSRYPTTGEFKDGNVMRSYISNFPPKELPSKICPQTYDYFNPSAKSYELRICLPKATSGYKQGWNVIKS